MTSRAISIFSYDTIPGMGRKKPPVDSDIRCERCTLSTAVGLHGIGECPLEPLHSLLRIFVGSPAKKIRRDPEALIQEYGAVKLSETSDGRKVLENARMKYRAELLQPHEPEFNKYWGKEVEKREKQMAELRHESQRMKREVGMT